MRIALAALLLLALTSCGGDGSDESAAAPTPAPASTSAATPRSTPSPVVDPKVELEQAYRAYVDAFLSGDGATSYALLSHRCQSLTPLSEFAGISESAAELYGPVKYTINSVTVDGKSGMVDAEYPIAALNQGGGSGWVLEGGEWRTDKCD